ncbi:MAG: Na/Pi cotransporter family protein [Gammaproteobacteria bacterium]|nr:Na/Pi cotransporter family protein [Gammaproteobacteria bacterium]NNF60037.1 Na/Pi cotransporter family protein [Gammaproteobacteria bacterium]NNM19968.1 Na/Pi cotransporter family protein [Gammaproteobacteria bacterium]
MDSGTLQLGAIIMGLVGGLSIFLYGMELLTDSLKKVAGERMKTLLARITTNRFKGVFAGAFTTAVIQSSSVTTVLAVGFVSAGLMNLRQSIGIIMGAEIGTTITAQIIAFKITKFALLAVSIGFLLNFFFREDRIKRYGLMVLGFGLVFFGMNMMGEATYPLRDYEPFINLLRDMEKPLFAVLLSAGFTALIQSSSATTGVIIVLASQGLITLEQGIALVFGANIGTSVTAVLASIGKPREAVRTALIHVTFNVLGVTLWFNFIDEVAALIRTVSPVVAGLGGIEKLAAETPRQIANAHTLFNVGNTLLFIWFVGIFVWIVTRLVPDKPKPEVKEIKPKYLDRELLETPTLAFDMVRLELGRLAQQVLPMVEQGPGIVMTGSKAQLDKLRQQDDGVDTLYDAIVAYIGELSIHPLTPEQSEMLHDYMSIAGNLESIGDTLETNLVHAGHERIRHNVTVSPETRKVIGELAEKVHWAVATSAKAVIDDDRHAAFDVIEAKSDINELVEEAEHHLEQRLTVDAPQRLATYRMETELIENLKRVYYFAKRIAKASVVESMQQAA